MPFSVSRIGLAQPLEEDGMRTKLRIVVSTLAFLLPRTDAGGVKAKKKLKVKLVR
jgi:hypothetical protein